MGAASEIPMRGYSSLIVHKIQIPRDIQYRGLLDGVDACKTYTLWGYLGKITVNLKNEMFKIVAI